MEKNRPLGWTTLEEAKKLVDAGLDPNTADMSYNWVECKVRNGNVVEGCLLIPSPIDDRRPYDQLPCWSIGALIDLMPSNLYTEIGYCYLSLYKDPMSFDRVSILFDHNLYRVAYDYEEGESCEPKDYKTTEQDESLMSVIVEMVIWLIQNNHIKKQE